MSTSPATDHTSIILSLLGIGVALAVCAIHIAGWKHKALVWGLLILAGLFALLAIFWNPISTAVPQVAAVIGTFASAPFIWFLALITALISTVLSNLKVKRLRSSNSTDLAVIDREWKESEEIKRIAERLKRVEERLDGAQVVPAVLEAHGRGDFGKLTDLSAQIEAIDKQLPRLNAAVDTIEHEERQRRAGSLLERIDLVRLPKGQVPMRSLVTPDRELYLLRHNEVPGLGVPNEAVEAEISRRVGEIKGDARYCTPQTTDDYAWESGDQKQAWYIRDATLDALKQIVADIETYRRKAKA